MASIDEHRALESFREHLEIIFEQREKQGELAMPNFFAALELLPPDQQLYVGTGMYRSFIHLLLNQHINDQLQRRFNAKPVVRGVCQKIWSTICKLLKIPNKEPTIIFPTIIPDGMLPSWTDEVAWLRDHADPESPISCFMMSELYGFSAKGEVSSEMKEWYAKGLRAARQLSCDNPDMPIKITE